MFPIDLLTLPREIAREALRDPTDTARLIEAKCRELGAPGFVRGIRFGPLVTTFAFEPAIGRRYTEVESVADDLGLAVQAGPVMVERVPGGRLIAIEIPNPRRQMIALRDVLESPAYLNSSSALTIALGMTTTGEPQVTDLATTPHFLIGGSRDAGKSVGLVALLTSILYRATPNDVRLVLIDPAGSALTVFDGIPHLRAPVITDALYAANVLRWTVRETERRYQILAAAGVRNLVQYNRSISQASADHQASEGRAVLEPLPAIVVVVVELAELMMAAPVDVEDAIVRLAQMSRAVGIHLVVATEHFSVGVVTGLIKANLPGRISYRVPTRVESRAILDRSGAERLLGRGDMLFLPPASRDCVRLHGPLVTQREASRVARHLRRQGPIQVDLPIPVDDELPLRASEPEEDPLYRIAARLVGTTAHPSISFLQRRLGIGFSRAARLLDRMRAEGSG